MPHATSSTRSYKDLTLSQLRSFCETARRGSFQAAAAALDVAHPTVWKQVHALEQWFATPLVEPHARGCRLTAAGAILVELIAPSVFNLESLRQRFDEMLRNVDVRITVAAHLRTIIEEVVPVARQFLASHPHVRLSLDDLRTNQIAEAVEQGRADIGLTTLVAEQDASSVLSFEPWYQLDVLLLTSLDHPLARRKIVRPDDLKGFPLLNARETLYDPVVHAAVERHGLFDLEPRRVEARPTTVLRPLVEAGLGIALVIGRLGREKKKSLHERVMSRYFGRSRIGLLRRRGVHQHAAVTDLAESLRLSMQDAPGAATSRPKALSSR